MSDFSLSPEPNIEVILRLLTKGTGEPLNGIIYKVRLFDKDIFDDDFIGESELDAQGVARITFTHKSFGDWGNLESRPDFYFVVLKDSTQIFESKVMEEVNLEAVERFKMGEGEVIDLGTYLIEA